MREPRHISLLNRAYRQFVVFRPHGKDSRIRARALLAIVLSVIAASIFAGSKFK